MTVYVFTGPTLTADEVRTGLDGAVALPPAAYGDVYRAARAGPQAIGIIDGYFERVPAVWHKEILWAMLQGIAVFGAASMGALRAAELAPFGMVGVGWIFDAYRRGALSADDEVAVVHGGPETGYQTQSEALVNIRATVRAAVADGVIGAELGDALVAVARGLFYPTRSWTAVLEGAARTGIATTSLAEFAGWLPTGSVDQKRADARAMLAAMRAHLDAGVPAQRVPWKFSATVWWDQLVSQGGVDGNGTEAAGGVVMGRILDELRLDEQARLPAYRGAMLRHLALSEARRSNFDVSREAVRQLANEFCWANGLETQEAFEAWLARNSLSLVEFNQLMRRQALIRLVSRQAGPELVHQFTDHLRVTSQFEGLVDRASRKQETLVGRGLANPSLSDAGFDNEAQLYEWYFSRSGRPVPVDMAAHCSSVGFADREALNLALLRQRCFELLTDEDVSLPANSS